ncbi:sodium bile acid symporter family protein [Trichuris trichiura]|uniref:Sodium bile acid symporter family protein n=1 Tax=Trichuris trichiura TaxID=36087 RepID=A0A077ZEI4_TRITR|nr:sodium bile acid symporter family protein [Trichuris trichiura]
MASNRRVRCPFALLLYFLAAVISSLLSATMAALSYAINVSFVPEQPKLLTENDNMTVSALVRYDAVTPDAAIDYDETHKVCYSDLQFKVTSLTPKIIAVDYEDLSAMELPPGKSPNNKNITFVVTGKFLGHGFVRFEAICSDSKGNNRSHTFLYKVAVTRTEDTLGYVFIGVLSILLCIANFIMASEIKLEVVWSVIKRPIAPAIGFFCQFVLMPLISFAVAQIAFIPYGMTAMGLGVFTAGCSPGGGASNAYTYLLDGNIDLSVTMTFLSMVFAYGNILRPFFFFVIVFICTFGVYSNLYMFKVMTLRALLAGLCVPWLGFAGGMALAMLLRQPRANVVAISLETGIQNTGIAIVMLQLSFPKPDSDIASVMPVIVALFTPVPVLVAMAFYYGRIWLPKLREYWKFGKGVSVRDKGNSFSSAAEPIRLPERNEGPSNGLAKSEGAVYY